MKTILETKKYKYCTTEKPFLTNCTSAIKIKEIQDILQNEVLINCKLVQDFNAKPIYSNLNREYAGLIGNTVALATEIIGHLFRYDIYKGSFEKEMYGAEKCLSKLDNKYKDKFNLYLSKVLEFRDNRNIVTSKNMHKLFDYVLEMSIFEKIYRGDNPNKLFEIDTETCEAIVNEVKNISRYTYKYLLKYKETDVTNSFFSNPIFSTNYSGIMADGGFIIGNSLYNMKTTKKSEPYKNDIYQVILYYLLSRSKKIVKELNNIQLIESDNIDDLYIYNSRFAHIYKIEINSLTNEEVDDIMFRIYSIIESLSGSANNRK